MAFDTWESYFYPPPDEGTLRNLFDERDPVVLTRLEYVETARRQRELLAGQVAIPKTYDADHVRAIHRHLFQDVYAWAGEFRSVNISKGAGRGFGDVKTGEVDQLLDDVRKRVAGTDWGRLDRDTFAERAATVFAYLNTGGSALLGCELYAYDLPPLDRARNGDRGVRPRRDHRIRGASAKASSSIERSP